MINSVVKNDGTKVPFDGEKIKSAVAAAASQASLSAEDAAGVAQNSLDSVLATFAEKEEVSSADIKEKVLAYLDASSPAVSAAWRKYDESKTASAG